MKNYLHHIIILFFSIILGISCSDLCDEIECTNGSKVDCSCVCLAGYEGLRCDIEQRSKFIGSWNAIADCGGSTDMFGFEFSEGDEISDMNMQLNFGSGFSLPTVVEEDLLLVSPTDIDFGQSSCSISGNGIISENNKIAITLVYDYEDGTIVNCSYNLER